MSRIADDLEADLRLIDDAAHALLDRWQTDRLPGDLDEARRSIMRLFMRTDLDG